MGNFRPFTDQVLLRTQEIGRVTQEMKGVILLEKQQQKQDPMDSPETLSTIPSGNEMDSNQGMRKN